MAKICSNCGAPCLDGDMFCEKCGAMVTETQEPQVPAQKKPTPTSNAMVSVMSVLRTGAKMIMNFMPLILVVMLVFTLVLGIMNFVAGHEVNVNAVASYEGETEKQSQPMKLSEIYEEEHFIPLAVSGIAYAVLNIALTGLAAFIVVKVFTGSRKTRKLMNTYCRIGLIGNVAYLLLVWIFGRYEQTLYGITMKATIAPHFTVWLAIVLFGVLTAASVLAPRKRRRR